ncbi:MAG: hypothetical protein FWC66_01750 [Oscillospiraceae bacterium]|nr:hypothetical protein [Oscillospiraceae bacterium]
MVRNYNDFVVALLSAGFSMGGGNADGIYAIINWGWQETPPYDTPIAWHTDNPETDPWEWRMRVLNERNDTAYAKLFFKKSGYITEEWYPYFLAVRRNGLTFDEAYDDGTISHAAKRIYDIVAENGALPTHTIKQMAGFSKEEKSAFDKALTELQMKMHLTMCGKAYKSIKQEMSNTAWASTVMATTESFFGASIFEQADKIAKDEAYQKIREQILKLNPSAEDKKVDKFIHG